MNENPFTGGVAQEANRIIFQTHEDKSNDYAAKGTQAHSLCAYKLKTVLGIKVQNPIESLTCYSEEMNDCANNYTAYVMKCLAEAKESCADPIVLIEQRVDFSRWVASGFSTADCILIAVSWLLL